MLSGPNGRYAQFMFEYLTDFVNNRLGNNNAKMSEFGNNNSNKAFKNVKNKIKK